MMHVQRQGCVYFLLLLLLLLWLLSLPVVLLLLVVRSVWDWKIFGALRVVPITLFSVYNPSNRCWTRSITLGVRGNGGSVSAT